MLAPGYLGYITAPVPEICLLGVGKGPAELGSDRIYGTSQAYHQDPRLCLETNRCVPTHTHMVHVKYTMNMYVHAFVHTTPQRIGPSLVRAWLAGCPLLTGETLRWAQQCLVIYLNLLPQFNVASETFRPGSWQL